MTSGTRNAANAEDAMRADGVIAALGAHVLPPSIGRELRGLLIAAFADCRHTAYADALADYKAARTDA